MARKRLIKGANAARVEARISRVPADLKPASNSIFGALKAMEREAALTAEPIPAEKPSGARSEARSAARRPSAPEARPSPARPSQGRLGPSDFSAAERETILRCCSDYRNRLPTYLLAVQRELKVIDSVIEKCRRATPGQD
jgi:hypothetical protein